MFEVGIVIPTYNRKGYLNDALYSILTQELPPEWNFRVVVVDDGSTDGTFEELCASFGKSEAAENEIDLTPQLSILRKTNAERGAARNFGAQWLIRHHHPQWLLFFDADDVMCASNLIRFAKRIADAGNSEFGAVYASIHVWESGEPIPGGETQTSKPEGDVAEIVLDRHLLALGGTLIRADVFKSLGGFSEDRAMSGSEDWALLYRLALAKPVIFSRHFAVNYRQHEDNTPPQNYFRSTDLAIQSVIPDVRQRFAGREDWAVKKLLRQVALMKIGAVNSHGLWRDALKIYGQSLERDFGMLFDLRTQRLSLSIAKMAVSDLRDAILPGFE